MVSSFEESNIIVMYKKVDAFYYHLKSAPLLLSSIYKTFERKLFPSVLKIYDPSETLLNKKKKKKRFENVKSTIGFYYRVRARTFFMLLFYSLIKLFFPLVLDFSSIRNF